MEPVEYRAMNPHGKAVIKAAQYLTPHETPSTEYPFALVTGRTLYHFHTRTKTARAPQLQRAAPEVWVEVSERDARRLGIAEGDAVEVSTARGSIRCAARISGIRDGTLFVPFHYGYFDADGNGHRRAGNELTITDWDPVSKQPIFKTAAAQLCRRGSASHGAAAAPTTAASAPVHGQVPATVGGPTAMATELVATQEKP
jgi:anaerobic selenocysteine-containing dehydrogenase